ncbi:MAG TPA: hypothetical protein EYM80_01145 [Deltaproteobacteria bacterium]|nr:hypothetical protein [Deltaproteobacteria bacterium]
MIKREATDFVDDHSLNKLVAADYDVMPPYCHSGRSRSGDSESRGTVSIPVLNLIWNLDSGSSPG